MQSIKIYRDQEKINEEEDEYYPVKQNSSVWYKATAIYNDHKRDISRDVIWHNSEPNTFQDPLIAGYYWAMGPVGGTTEVYATLKQYEDLSDLSSNIHTLTVTSNVERLIVSDI